VANPNDLFNAVRNYANALNNGDKSPAQMMEEINKWFKESSQEIRERIETEVVKTVEKMGFAKRSEVEKLRSEINQLKSQIASGSSGARKSNNSSRSNISSKSKKKKSK
jgi:uncharacterized phage infection (PIP) family protein YhgE